MNSNHYLKQKRGVGLVLHNEQQIEEVDFSGEGGIDERGGKGSVRHQGLGGFEGLRSRSGGRRTPLISGGEPIVSILPRGRNLLDITCQVNWLKMTVEKSKKGKRGGGGVRGTDRNASRGPANLGWGYRFVEKLQRCEGKTGGRK